MMIGKNKYSSDRFPLPGETCAFVVDDCYKKAALLFDKIHVYDLQGGEHELVDVQDEIPVSLTFGMSAAEKGALKMTLTDLVNFSRDVQIFFGNTIEEPLFFQELEEDPDQIELANRIETLKNVKESESVIEILNEADKYIFQSNTKAVISSYAHCGITMVPCYEKLDLFNDEYPSGPTLVYQAALANLPVVDEKEVSWEQILRFRDDSEAARKYRALRTWLDQSVRANSVQEATDIIGKKLDDYEWAIKKHSLLTIKSALSQVLELNKAGATLAMAGAAGVVGGPIWSAIAAGLVVTSQVALSLIERKIELEDIKRGEHAEVALIYDARKAFEE